MHFHDGKLQTEIRHIIGHFSKNISTEKIINILWRTLNFATAFYELQLLCHFIHKHQYVKTTKSLFFVIFFPSPKKTKGIQQVPFLEKNDLHYEHLQLFASLRITSSLEVLIIQNSFTTKL